MRTLVRIRDLESGLQGDYTLVYPWEADVDSNRVSVLAPLGTALLGYREGDQIEWHMPGGMRRLRVEKILHQPEAKQREAHAA
jgi:regulator of nucleoside diphosphate kinase